MAPLETLTNRLILRVETEARAKEVLDLYLRNRLPFERYEPTRPTNFYSLDYHQKALHREYVAYTMGNFLRYYVYLKTAPQRIIGAVNLNIFQGQDSPYAELGYKIDTLHQNQGLGYEACLASLKVLHQHYGICQVDARIHPTNTPSIRLAEKMGFAPLRLEVASANIMGRYEDLMRYSLHISNSQNFPC